MTLAPPTVRLVLTVLAGTALGAAMGWFGQGNSGTCLLTSTWWRGALYGAFLGLLVGFNGHSS